MRLMIPVLLAASALAVTSHAATPDAAETALLHKAETCVQTQAPAAAVVSKTSADAVTFLVSGLCAEDIENYENYQRNAALLAGWRAQPPKLPIAEDGKPLPAFEKQEADKVAAVLAALPDITIDPRTGEMHTPPGFLPTLEMNTSFSQIMMLAFGQQAHFMTVAAQNVLTALTAQKAVASH